MTKNKKTTRADVSPIVMPPVFVCFSIRTHTFLVSFAKGVYSSHQEKMNQPKENQRVAMHHYYAWPAYHTLYIIYMRTNSHTNFNGRGGRSTEFLCKKQYIAITANRHQDKPHYIQKTTYHGNLDSISAGSIYDTKPSFSQKTKSRFNACLTQAPKTVFKPDQT